MNELVIMHNKQAMTTSLRVAEVFGKDHKHVLETISNLAAEKSAAKFFSEATYDNRGKQYPMYYMNRDGFTLLAMGFTGKKALQFKISYINAFNSMETQIKTGYVIPGSYAEALKLAASQAEQIEDMKPKALFADAVATSHTSILIGDLAKLIRQNGVDIGQNRLFAWMREHGYLIGSGDRRNMPTQRAMDLELFDIKERTFQNPDGSVRITKTTKVTGKGQQYFINKFLQKEAI
ncbi:phage regulatory protein/antirepressor Ant [Lacticaseibacillus rhamnosus]|uniref:phage regulatory protein/antirepressor Ant n=1 Tax=Lacticaseibacillus rhamnosus TaxID=47715 RepID=UPI00237FAC6D|nr:phage regulatory protein/antirepressor Ant [Lacticaseibacillus rhamnosus]MDE3295865.1 phage regulatory protein/antirepressor Ant [Lacticaseibacillus rhamnosus]